jgi:quinol monooxygenase YgiN
MEKSCAFQTPSTKEKYIYGMCTQVIELLTSMAKFVKENEPKTLKYQLHREINKKTGVDDLVMLERYIACLSFFLFRFPSISGASRLRLVSDFFGVESYVDMDAVKAHGASKEFKQFYQTMAVEDLLTGPTKLKWLKAVSGFESRL